MKTWDERVKLIHLKEYLKNYLDKWLTFVRQEVWDMSHSRVYSRERLRKTGASIRYPLLALSNKYLFLYDFAFVKYFSRFFFLLIKFAFLSFF